MSTPQKKSLLGTITQLFKTWRHSPVGETARLDPHKAKKEQARPRLVTLRITCPGEEPQLFPLQGSDIYLGRSGRASTIRIPADSVSHIHARIREVPPPALTVPGLSWRWSLQGFCLGLGWYPARYLLLDQDSTNGIYKGQRRIRKIALHHRLKLSLGPPSDRHVVKLQVVDPPPPVVYLARGVMATMAGLVLAGLVWVGQEWGKIPVDPLPTATRGPFIVLAGDEETQLRRTWGDAEHELPNLAAFGNTLPAVVVAAEDHRFYGHWGVDLIGILRAAFVNLRAGEVQQGGSSITQQLARNILREYTGAGNTLGRKWREALAAMKLETRYSKQELLTLYLNNVYLGNGIYGFEAASRYYFGVPCKDLDLSSAATLAGILPAPNAFNPVDDYDAAVKGRDRVLDRLLELKLKDFSAEALRRARRSRLILNPKLKAEGATVAPYFYNTVMSEAEALLGRELATEGNFIVETSVQLPLQALAERTLAGSIQQWGSTYGVSQGALVTLNSTTGEVLSLVGGIDYNSSQFNRAVQAQRQPGSTFKIFTYAAAIEQGIPINQVFSCDPFRWGGQTFKGCRTGGNPLSLAQGLILSENVVALRLAQEVGLNRMVAMAHQMGIESPLDPYPAVVLGTMEVNLLELTGSFAVLANQGVRTHPHTIRRILDSSDCGNPEQFNTCREVYPGREDPSQRRAVLRPEVAATLTTLLQGVVQSGTGRSAYLGLGEAGKTGTTTDNKDLLFVGYIPYPPLVTGIWLGNDNSSPTRGSSALAAQIWADYMRQAIRP
jgi:membrane peptidoglycan carboxypeptidase